MDILEISVLEPYFADNCARHFGYGEIKCTFHTAALSCPLDHFL